jgi:hypothetical protein
MFFSLAFISMAVFVLALNNGWLQKSSGHYESHSGKIISISKYESGGMSQSSSPQVRFGIRLKYEYQVDGEKLVNNIIFKNADTVASSDEAWADGFIRSYPLGKVVQVKVNPQNLKDTYLIEKSPASGFFNFLSVLMICIGMLIYYFDK